MKNIISDLLQREAQAVLNIPQDNDFEKAILIIEERVQKLGGKLVTSGMGKAGQIALNISTTFCSTGTPSIFLHPSEAQHGDLGVIQPNDVLLLISNSGRTSEIVALVHLAENLYPGLPLIVITSKSDSDLAEVADIVLLTGNPKELCPLGLTPSTSTTTMTVIGDILVNLMMKKINFTNEQYAKRHHGGYLGEKSKRQSKKQ
ncbi:SIS domain-containing protein [Halosquirtibacter laminarini]|uniref:SIS domain-containing protein n=1 Tax=Halosquirtibacter laminarini TaxID=3374600 RepID=A0AC61NM40_9BACT|nr:SIS domain-containing protein [Prolixibacteraceae bacterium]